MPRRSTLSGDDEQELSRTENLHGTITGMLEMLPWPLYVMAGCLIVLLVAPAVAVVSESRARSLQEHRSAHSRKVGRRWQQAARLGWSACPIVSAVLLLCLVPLAR
ncbi:hypothetical protein [Rhodococcus sp. NPDC060176]|uniref:hypothetical protein n=1 Tax=Rhodococcus sp. NPDC060176 TaxID=3347062 RepID=UPI00365CD661